MKTMILAAVSALLLTAPLAAQEIPAEYEQVLKVLGRPGDFSDGVLKINIPRGDLPVTVAGVATPTAFGFGGWVAMTKGDGGIEVAMGDLVLTEDEVNPVMSALFANGFEVTALHNHFFHDVPRVFYLHVHGHGPAAHLATHLKPALALIGAHKASAPAGPAGATLEGTLTTARLAEIIGAPGELNGRVFKITLGRPDIDLREMGARINARMGLNSWAAFFGNDAEAVVAGDLAMLEREVTPVLKSLRASGIDVVAIHHHMVGTRPAIIFLHYWGRGPAERLATGVKAALAHLGSEGRPR